MTTAVVPSARRLRLPPAGDSGRCRVLGIVNVTPDSFSDGGRFGDASAAVERGLTLVRLGADLVDAGAILVNDVSGGLADPDMLPCLADADVPCVLMHWRAHSNLMQQRTTYQSVVEDVRSELARRCDAAAAAGISADRIILDPGLGFAKTSEHNWSVLAQLPRLMSLGFPLLVGASRKAFLGECVDYGDLDPRRPVDRDDVSAAVAAIAAMTGVWGVRVHDVPAAAAGSRVAARLTGEGPGR